MLGRFPAFLLRGEQSGKVKIWGYFEMISLIVIDVFSIAVIVVAFRWRIHVIFFFIQKHAFGLSLSPERLLSFLSRLQVFLIFSENYVFSRAKMLPVVDEGRHFEFLRKGLLLKSALGLMVVLKIFFIIIQCIEDIVVIEGITNCKVFGHCRQVAWLSCKE